MSYGTSTNAGAKYIALKAKTSETDPTPYFGLKTKSGDKYEISEKFTFVEGVLEEMKTKQYTWEKQLIDVVTIKMRDADEVYFVEGNLSSSLMRNILNSILGTKEKLNGRVHIDLGLQKAKEGETKRYAASWVKIDGENTTWAYKYDEFPKIEKNKKGVIIDDEAYMEFMRKMVTDINGYLVAPVTSDSGEPATETQPDGLPF